MCERNTIQTQVHKRNECDTQGRVRRYNHSVLNNYITIDVILKYTLSCIYLLLCTILHYIHHIEMGD